MLFLFTVLIHLSMTGTITAAVMDEWKFVPRAVNNGMFKNSARSRYGDNNRQGHAVIHGEVQFTDITPTLILDGGLFMTVGEDVSADDMPNEALSIEAWVRIDSDSPGIIIARHAVSQSKKSGWCLLHNKYHYVFEISTENGNATVKSADINPGDWHHVTVSYDGALTKLYLDSELADESNVATGAINYTDTDYTIGGGRSAADNMLIGGLHRIRVHDSPLSADDIRISYVKAGPVVAPEPIVYFENTGADGGPWLEFTAENSAIVTWHTKTPMPSILLYGLEGSLDKRIESTESATDHRIEIPGLRKNTRYSYALVNTADGEENISNTYLCDTFFNYSRLVTAKGKKAASGKRADRAYDIAKKLVGGLPNDRGYCLDIGCGDGVLAETIARLSRMNVIAVDTDKSTVNKARQRLRKAGIYGSRVTVMHVGDLDKLPFRPNTFNLVVSSAALFGKGEIPTRKSAGELLRPDGGIACIDPNLSTFTKNSPATNGEWTHQYGGTHNAAFSGETLSGAETARELDVQWIGRPGPRAMVDRNSRVPAPLSVGGRLFTQGYNRIIAQDAYNGAILWSKEIPNSIRMNMPRDAGNWCADNDALYFAVREKCLKIDAVNGSLLDHFDVPRDGTGGFDWGYVAQTGDLLIGSMVKTGAVYTGFWSGQNWYDQHMPGYSNFSGYGVGKVTSDALFACDKDSGTLRWQRNQGVIINSTICAGQGCFYFLECRNADIIDSDIRRITDTRLFDDIYLVALNETDGTVRWERQLRLPSDVPVIYLSYGEGALVLVSSVDSQKAYEINVFEASDGSPRWKNGHSWTGDNHSGHMQHQVVVNGRVYVEPVGYSLADGTVLTRNMGRHSGCATYVGTSEALLYRGDGRRIAMWSYANEEFSAWDRLRPGCWLTTIPAAGMILSPEGGGGCSCGSWMETSLAFAPLRCPAPTATPLLTRFVGSVEVSLAVPDENALIRYTLDGSHPTSNSSEYRSPIMIENSATILTRAYLSDGTESPEAAIRFTEIEAVEPAIVNETSPGLEYGLLDTNNPPENLAALVSSETVGNSRTIDPAKIAAHGKPGMYFSGLLMVEADGLYHFRLSGNERVALYIGGQRYATAKSGSSQLAEIGLKKGPHEIGIFCTRGQDRPEIDISFGEASSELQPLPENELFHRRR